MSGQLPYANLHSVDHHYLFDLMHLELHIIMFIGFNFD